MNTVIGSKHDNSATRDAFWVAVAGIVALWLSMFLFPDASSAPEPTPEPAPNAMTLPVAP